MLFENGLKGRQSQAAIHEIRILPAFIGVSCSHRRRLPNTFLQAHISDVQLMVHERIQEYRAEVQKLPLICMSGLAVSR